MKKIELDKIFLNDILKKLSPFINKGDIIKKEHVRRIRPGFGLNPKYYEKVIGTMCIKSAKRGDRVTFQHISDENL